MSFLFPTLLWIGLPLVAAPILLHLLNLRRQRRVEWAAMDFLLESDRKNRRWVNLSQWLLLLARVALVALAALMLAKPQLIGDLASWFSADSVQHVIVLDDSFSMSDRSARAVVWEDALAAIGHVVESAARGADHRVAVFRTSQSAADPAAEPEVAAGRADLPGLGERVGGWRPSQSAAGVEPALEAAARWVDAFRVEGPVVAYVIGDFRAKNVEPADRFARALAELNDVADAVHLTPCAAPGGDNLAVTGLTLLPGARAAALELTAEVTVTNFGERPAPGVTVEIAGDGQPLPAAAVGDVPPRESRSCKFPVRFALPGSHWLQASIGADAIEADDRRRFAVSLPDKRPVLIVDGSPGGHEGAAYAAALRPGGVTTGWAPERGSLSQIEASGALERYAAVFLLDPSSLSPAAVNELRRYLASGGGVFVSLGASADRPALNQVAFAGADAALAPIVLDLPTQTPPPTLQAVGDDVAPGDLVVSDHPLFRVFRGDRNSFLQLITVSYYHSLTGGEGWIAPDEPNAVADATVIASLASGAPLAIETLHGDGRCVTLLTTASRPAGAIEGWSNLGLSPVFPVIVNELAAHLAAPRLVEPAVVVGQPWPTGSLGGAEGEPLAIALLGPDGQPVAGAVGAAPQESGLYRVAAAADRPARVIAANVDAAEGDLAGPTAEELRKRFAGQGVVVTSLAEFLRSDQEESQASIGRMVAAVILALLLLEKALAVRCSYHQPESPPAGAPSTRALA